MPLLPGTPQVEITLRRSVRARRFSLRVSRLDGRVTLSLPMRAREADALAFAVGQEAWIRRALEGVAPGAIVDFGTVLPVAGQALTIRQGVGRIRVQGDSLLVSGDPGPRVQAWLKTLARDRLASASDRYAALIGRRYARITLRDTRSRWGSCTADGGLMYNWRLILAPPEVLDYVAAHEVAHLAEMNHSPAFWAVVAGLMPDYAPRRAWLKREGGSLHAWQFTC